MTFQSRLRVVISLTNTECSSAHQVEVHSSPRKTLMNRIVGILAASAVVSGCATSQQQIDSHAPAMNSWVGAPIEEFLDRQGPPRAVVDKDNYQVYKFGTAKAKIFVEMGEHCAPTANFNEPINDYGELEICSTVQGQSHTITYWCTYGLIVVEDVIRDWRMDGNNCKMITVYGRPGLAEIG